MGRNQMIRRAINDIEDLVKASSVDGFAQPQMFPFPDELEPEIPRVVFTSKGGHSQLMVSQISITFNVTYSDDWAADHEKCLNYLASKVRLLFDIARAGWKSFPGPSFTGVTTVFRAGADSQKAAVAMAAQFFANREELIASANELSCRRSLSVGDHFFNNLALQTFAGFDQSLLVALNGIPKMRSDSLTACGVEVSCDYNDRLAFNERDDYVSSESTLSGMLAAGFQSALEAVGTIRQGAGNGE
ncbi:hypothetical protein ABRP17_016675 [Stenotrophomonas sp. WHRI 8082]|uniref:hypothetical protein n=1 Tax=Stenotrophomonas sp. WHRI 8082 TaxID=3162571 RepID=UPI0032F0030F